jgi:hypothetical protein
MPPKKLKQLEAQDAKLSSDAERSHELYKQALADLNAFQVCILFVFVVCFYKSNCVCFSHTKSTENI